LNNIIDDEENMSAETLPATTPKHREYRVRRPLQRAPVHPGGLMREILEEHVKMTITEAARQMKISRPALYAVLNGTAAVTAEMALRFAGRGARTSSQHAPVTISVGRSAFKTNRRHRGRAAVLVSTCRATPQQISAPSAERRNDEVKRRADAVRVFPMKPLWYRLILRCCSKNNISRSRYHDVG
jgi:addiction module HigA family antidote